MDEGSPLTKQEIGRSFIGTLVIVVVIVASALLLGTPLWYLWPFILVISLVSIAFLTVSKKMWRCPSCGESYRISVLQDFLAFHGVERRGGRYFEWKRLRCPRCGVKSKSFPVDVKDGTPK
jgi:ribosomal protein S27AE